MSAITWRQNTPENLRLLAAQRQIYSRAKFLHNTYAGASVVLEAIAPWAILWHPESKEILDIVGAILLIASLSLGHVVSRLVKQGATVQEMFDTDVFELPWNHTLVGSRVAPEPIRRADQAFKGNRSALRNWYADPGDVPRPLDVLLCQRSGIVWDRQLRQRYAWLFNAVTVSYFLVGVAILTLAGRTLSDYIVSLLVPSLPAFLEGLRIVKDHREIAEEEERVGDIILETWDAGLSNLATVTMNKARELQDCSYLKRSRGPLVPDWWYWRYRDRDEAIMREAVEEFRIKAAQKRRLT